MTTADLEANGGRVVVELGGGKILIQSFMGDVYAVSNRCPHLGLSMQGKTALLSAEMRDDGCIVCPAHKSAFKLDTGEPVGEWCPGLPSLPVVGKPLEGTPEPIPVFPVRVLEGSGVIEVRLEEDVSAAGGSVDAEDVAALSPEELAALRNLPLADAVGGGTESVMGAEGIPQPIIEAERRSKPLRRYRLGSYVAASMAAAAQMVSIIQNGVERWPAFQDQAPLQIFSDVLVIVSGSLLWRTELANRAESLKMIWEKARFREESLNRAEAGLGDTLWTSRMRKRASNTNNNAGGNGGAAKEE